MIPKFTATPKSRDVFMDACKVLPPTVRAFIRLGAAYKLALIHDIVKNDFWIAELALIVNDERYWYARWPIALPPMPSWGTVANTYGMVYLEPPFSSSDNIIKYAPYPEVRKR